MIKSKHVEITLLMLVSSIVNTVTATTVNQCNDNLILPEVEIINCDQQPCIFYINEETSMSMKFRAPGYLENIATKAKAEFLGSTANIILSEDACEGITNTPCPLAANEYIEYSYSMTLFSVIPETSLSLEFSLVDKDRDNEEFVCFQLYVQTKRK